MASRKTTLHPSYPPSLGAIWTGEGRCRFRVWAPKVEKLELKLETTPEQSLVMQPRSRGYWELEVEGVQPGSRYSYRLDGQRELPDPGSRWQPDGVHEPSAVVDPQFDWDDDHWHGLPLRDYITYEMHVGTFSPEGTFDGAIPCLDDLVDLGVTAIELMPLAQFPGGRNWGYDGVYPFAVQSTYGGPLGLKRLINAAHRKGLAVIIDVVYNHMGPEGNYLAEYGHYFTDRHQTPWGRAINFDDRGSDEVRRFFIENALYWIDEFHADALRLDAAHAIYDFSARPFLQELGEAVRIEGERVNRRVYAIAESSLSDSQMLMPKEMGGLGLDGQWCDDLHHAIRTEVTDERSGYYEDYNGFEDIVKAYRDGFVQDGGYSEYRGRRHGNSARHIEPFRLVVCSQNHDQVGNRLMGERLPLLTSFEQLKLAAATVLLSPCQPMLFMGEEYGETAPFQFFISHGDEQLVEAVRRGRKEEFARFQWNQEPPDPQAVETFERCKLNHALKSEPPNLALREFYKQLIEIRKSQPGLRFADRQRMDVEQDQQRRVMFVRYEAVGGELLAIFHFGAESCVVERSLPPGRWQKVVGSAATRWAGPGDTLPEQLDGSDDARLPLTAHSVTVYKK